MYRATKSFTAKDYRVKYREILADDFTTQDEINEYLEIGYIVEYDGTLEITENGIYNVKDYENADVNVSGGSSDIEWTEIGYESTPQGIIDGFNYAKEIQENWDSSVTTLDSEFFANQKLVIMPLVDTSNVTNMRQTFNNATGLISVPLLDTSKVINFQATFKGCDALESIPLLDTSSATVFLEIFRSCENLVTIPLFDTHKVTDMGTAFGQCTNLMNVPILDTSMVANSNFKNVFSACPNLTNASLNNILKMCINAVKVTSATNKTLKVVGLSQEQAEICMTLSNYQDFVNAGWSTGY